MTTLLHVEYPYPGPFGEEMGRALRGLAESIANEPGLIQKIWTENHETQEAGGVCVFETRELAENYLAKYTARLKMAGIVGVHGEFYEVNEKLTAITSPARVS
ncbi:MAG TPA: monooxygenase [Planctomycetaceae bacterium]|nr:monooxygenase [Planctomycetaceae bacterium]